MKYALIGCGRIAPNHIAAAEKNGLEIVAVCDILPSACKELCEKKGISAKIYTDYKEMVEKEAPDLIAIATDSGKHAEIAKFCIKKGCNLIIEKPISLKISDAEEIVKLAKEYNVKVSACHQNRFNVAIQKTRKALEEGRLGNLSHGSIVVRWSRDKSYYDQAAWRGTWEGDGGALMNQCIHGFDLLRWMFGDEIDEVYAVTTRRFHSYIEGEDLGQAVIKFKNGCIATAEGTTNIFSNSEDTEILSLFGDKGAIEVGGTAANKIIRWAFSDETEEDSALRETTESAKNVYGNGHASLYADVIDAIENDREPYVSAEAGKRALELILAIYKSSKTGQSVKFPLNDFSTTEMIGFFD